MKFQLLILGAGQYGMVAKEIAESVGIFEKIAFLDDKNEIAIGKLNSYGEFADKYDSAVVAIGNSEVRWQYIDKLIRIGYNIATLISPLAYVAPSGHIGDGSIIEPMAVIHTNSMVGIGTIVCAGSIVNHNAVVGDVCLLQCGSIVSAGSTVPTNTVLDYRKIYPSALEPIGKIASKVNNHK